MRHQQVANALKRELHKKLVTLPIRAKSCARNWYGYKQQQLVPMQQQPLRRQPTQTPPFGKNIVGQYLRVLPKLLMRQLFLSILM